MASNFHIQKPYVLATLPTPLQRPETPGRCLVGVVFGQRPKTLKRSRRPELAIGIDGDAANLYDVPASRLITSYPIPPQYFFTCAPCSIRWKANSDKIVRYTYATTEETQTSKRRATLFKDVVEKAGVTTSTSNFVALRLDTPVVYLTTTPIFTPLSSSASDASVAQHPSFNLLAVTSDGTIVCFDRETLAEKWRAPSSAYLVGASGAAKLDCTVESAQTALATEVIEGFFQGKADLLAGLFNQKVAQESFDPDVLVLIVSSQGQRELVLLAIHDSPSLQSSGSSQGRVFQVSTAILPTPSEATTLAASYQLHVESGSLQELRGNNVYTYRVEDGAPRLSYTLPVPNASSFLRLSDTSVLTATASSLSIYNPGYRSVQASTPLDLATDVPNAAKSDDSSAPYQLITYFRRLDVAIGIRGSSLFAAQLEAPKTRKRKRRAEGLLIDSIGRGLSHAMDDHKWAVPDQTPDIFASYVPGSLSEAYWKSWAEDTAKADEFLRNKDVPAFEELIATKLGVNVTSAKGPNGVSSEPEADAGDAMELDAAAPAEEKPQVDRRWVLFAITKLFALDSNHADGLAKPKLLCQLPGSLVAEYLISAGYMSVSNVKSAFSSEAREIHEVDALLAEQIPELIAGLDPTLELLVEYLTTTKPSAVELLASIRLIMRSLDLVQDPTKLAQKLIGFGETETAGEANEEEALGMKLDKLEEDLEVTEYHLLDDSSTRARGLTVAFDLLGSCSPVSTVQAIRRLFRPEETLSLIHVLRVELVKGGWTARYLDTSLPDGEEDELEPPPDGSIRLIADLLCRCIDSVGSGGWMINDALLARTGDHLDSADFLAGLKLEISAALEGIQEAVYLRGLLTETVKFGNTVQQGLLGGEAGKTPLGGKGTPHKQAGNTPHKGTPYKGAPGSVLKRNKPLVLAASAAEMHEMQMLPLGLGSRQRVPATKLAAGGEIVTRSKREIGHLVSQRVGAYSLERIVV
ncbi:hypothetical protein CONLIGDRAFT_638043 [Coniochaeta ligniaria NRRL 30616]|uniref:Uncharacterized protein n=1 Tax=Coniochaeta ligniaria NRRL 30616 TaxID=1408157 RepID=A0A1J7I574_9PEZI|nr:hypothetical protein CONLIGDRAFT_638043 [Coniochaeta ligniaria NRRL 30616]